MFRKKINTEEQSFSLSRIAWQRLLKNKIAMLGVIIIAFATIVAFLGALIRPDFTPHANDQFLQLGKKKPGFSVQMIKLKKEQEIETTYFWELLLFGGKEKDYTEIPIHSYFIKNGIVTIEEYSGMNDKIMGKVVEYPFSYFSDNENITAKGIEEEFIYTKTYWLGTDQFGRDLLSRLMAGTIVSLSVGFISVFISVIIGLLMGALSGYYKGWVDDIIMWIINVVWSVPTLLLVIAITFALGKGFWQIFVAVGLTMWVEVARIVRGQIISLREKEFVEAGKALGFDDFRIISKHIVPNVMGAVIVISAANFASAIIIESGLSFLGIGMQPPMASWGRMIKEHYGFIMVDGAYLAILPGLAIMIMVLAFMLVGNGLRDALDNTSNNN